MNYLFLTNKTEAQKFLNDNSSRIFGRKSEIEIINIKRFKTFNEENSLNAYYELEVDDVGWKIRVSTSTFLEKKRDYNVMKYFYNNGFNHGSFVVPQPIAYLNEEKILIYKDVSGQKLANIFKQNGNIEEYVRKCATLVKKIHLVKIPTFQIFNPEFLFSGFKFQEIEAKFPKAQKMASVVQAIKSHLPTDGAKVLCHGDFNPNNLLIDRDQICLIDFSMTSAFYKEIDLASFLAHSRVIMDDQSKFKKLQNIFLGSYSDFNEQILYLLMSLIDCRLLEISTLYENNNFDSNFIWSCLDDDLKKASIKIKDES